MNIVARQPAKSFDGEIVADDGSILHDEFYGFERANIGGGVAGDRNDMGVVAGLDGSDLLGPADDVGGFDGGSLNGVDRLHAEFDHLGELLGVVPVRINTCVGAEGHLGAALPGPPEVFAL